MIKTSFVENEQYGQVFSSSVLIGRPVQGWGNCFVSLDGIHLDSGMHVSIWVDGYMYFQPRTWMASFKMSSKI